MSDEPRQAHSVSIVVPVYAGSSTLPDLLEEIASLTSAQTTPTGRPFVVREVLLVHDHGPDDSAATIRQLADSHEFVSPIWLSRNFGQHAATLAGMSSTGAEWIVTMDEDGQHDPGAIGRMLDVALDDGATVVYAEPTNPPPHGLARNATSAAAKWLFVNVLSSGNQRTYHSYRLVSGEIGRSLAAYIGPGTYLDVGLGWITDRFSSCPVQMRREGDRTSGYSMRSLISHFWRLVRSSGTRPMRLMSAIGAVVASLGFVAAVLVLIGRVTGRIEVEGWASLSIVTLVGTGVILLTLGIAAEYIGLSARMAMGQPPYLIVSDDENGPLASRRREC